MNNAVRSETITIEGAGFDGVQAAVLAFLLSAACSRHPCVRRLTKHSQISPSRSKPLAAWPRRNEGYCRTEHDAYGSGKRALLALYNRYRYVNIAIP
jgi:N-acetyl-anhydromuramyl-L-alanine amidase AmpD